MFFIGTLSQTLTLRAAFASSTYLLSQIPGPGRSSDDDLLIPLIPFSGGTSRPSGAPERMATASLFFGRHLMIYLNPPDPIFKGAIRAFGLSIASWLPCPPTPAWHLMMPCSALEGGACEAGGPGPHGGFLLLGMITSISGKFRHITNITLTKKFKNCK